MNTADYEKLAGFRSRPHLVRDLDMFRAALEQIAHARPRTDTGRKMKAIAVHALSTSPQPLAHTPLGE